ncbi:MAG: DUF885 domain-containing protein [Candidatus Riflebacteria bacterium]|nr:DUF885 domain-containing protein [Candidatus Riflebacteria bacterium]
MRTHTYCHPGFINITDRYYADLLRLNPIGASWLGEHEYDCLLPDAGAEAQEREIAFFREMRDVFSALPERELSIDERLDRRVVMQLTRNQLFMQEDMQRWKLGADLARSLGDAIFVLFIRDFAPLAIRVESIIARLKAAPIYLHAGRTLFQQVPPLWCDIFIESAERFPALLDVIQTSIENRVPVFLMENYIKAAKLAREAVEEHMHWFRHAIAPRAQGNWAMGAGSFQALLALRELGLSGGELLELGERALHKAHERIDSLAAKLAPSRSRSEAHAKIREKTPNTFPQVLDAYRDAVVRSRLFVERTDFATLPDDEMLDVIETPEYLTHLIPFAAYAPPERVARPQKGCYMVTRPPVDEGLGRHNYADITNTSIHEGYPGHHLQFATQNMHPGKMRIFADSIEFIEGWAHYCEEETKRLGFEASDENLFIQSVDEAWRAARVLIDVNIQSGTWNFEQGVECLLKNTEMNRSAAEAEMKWYSQAPGYPLSYLTGKHLLMKLKDELKHSFGSDFSEKHFHDLILCEGSLPIFLCREFYPEMLRDSFRSRSV